MRGLGFQSGPCRRNSWASMTMIAVMTGALWGPSTVRAADELPEGAAPTMAVLESVVQEAERARVQRFAKREARLSTQERRLTRLRGDLNGLIAENRALLKEIKRREGLINKANNDKIRRLIKVYEAMAPEEAAPILDTMQERTALALFAGMKGKSAAGIMEFMPTDKAAQLGERLARPE